MHRYVFPRRIAACTFLLLALTGCSPRIVVESPTLSGTYEGVTGDGKTVVLSLDESEGGFSGHGLIDGSALVISGTREWSGVGAVTHANGSSSPARLLLSQSGDRLTFEAAGIEAITLVRGGTPLSVTPGSFTGRYRSDNDEPPTEVTVVQNGALISGVGLLLGQSAGITGRLINSNQAQGSLTFADESQASFRAELSGDGRSLTIRGLGDPVVLTRP